MKMTAWLILKFGGIVLRSVFYCGLFQDFKFSLIISWLFQGEGRTYLATPLCFSWLKQTKYQKISFLLSSLYLKDIPYNGASRETLDRVHVKYVMHKGAFTSKTFATFVQKVGLIQLKGGFLLQLLRTHVIVGLK